MQRVYSLVQKAVIDNSSHHSDYYQFEALIVEWKQIKGQNDLQVSAIDSILGTADKIAYQCPLGAYCLGPDDPSHDIDRCVGMTIELKAGFFGPLENKL